MALWPFGDRPEEWINAWMGTVSGRQEAGAFAVPGWPVNDPIRLLLDAVQRRLIGRRRTVRVADQDVSLLVTALRSTGDTAGPWNVGQYGEIELAARDVETAAGGAAEVTLLLQNVQARVDGSGGVTLIGAPLRWTAAFTPDQLRGWMRSTVSKVDVSLVDGAVLFRHARRLRRFALEARVSADGVSVRLEPVAIRAGSRRIAVRWPARRVAWMAVGGDDFLTGVSITPDRFVLSGIRVQWRWSATGDALQRVLSSIKRSGEANL